MTNFKTFFHCQNQYKICNSTITKDSTPPQVCCYTQTTSVTTKFRVQDVTVTLDNN